MRPELGTAAPIATPLALLRQMPLAALAAVAVAGLGLLNILQAPDRLATALGDTDDATRLVAVRELIAGAPWLDTTLARFGGAEPLVSHWSRLVDLPLMLLMQTFGLLLGAERAELVVRAVWPLVVLVPLAYLLARDAEVRAGRLAAWAAIGLALTAMSGLVQFLPGRIDHHNVQILGCVGGALLLVRSLSQPALAVPAGVLLGLGTAVGYEALLLTSMSLALTCLTACWSGRGVATMARAAAAFAGTLGLAFLLTTAPGRWLDVRCDALSANLLLLASVAAAGLVLLATRTALPSRPVRLAVLLGCGCLGLALFAGLEPACLRGPFGQVDPAVVPIWLDSVVETHSIVRQARTHALMAVAWIVFAAIGLAAAAWTLRPRAGDGDAAQAMLVALAVALSLWQLKLIPYATFLLVPTLAACIAGLSGTREISAPVARGAAFLLANQMTVTIAVVAILAPLGLAKSGGAARSAAPCLAPQTVGALDALPRGRFAGDIDLGPFIVAASRHDALAAPYHRLGGAILANHQIMTGPLEAARQRLTDSAIQYVAICPGLQRGDARATQGLRGSLLAGAAPDWLERIDLPAAAPVQVWRVRGAVPYSPRR